MKKNELNFGEALALRLVGVAAMVIAKQLYLKYRR